MKLSMSRRFIGLLTVAASLQACDDGDSPSGTEADMAAETDAAVGDGGVASDSTVEADMAQLVETPIEERCPDARAGQYLLVGYPDRVQAYRFRVNAAMPDQPTYVISDFCTFLALGENGITNANGFAFGEDGFIYVVSDKDGEGKIHRFNVNGEFDSQVVSNINLDRPSGIWNTFGDSFIVHSGKNNNLYAIGGDGSYGGPWVPPSWQGGSRVESVTDMVFIGADAVVMTFADREARLFKAPFSPAFNAEDVGPGNAVQAVTADEGTKLVMTAQARGAGNGYGVALFKPQMDGVFSGRTEPTLERYIVEASVIEDGKDLVILSTGFLVLDSGLAGAPRISGFNLSGEDEGSVELTSENRPTHMKLGTIFPDF